MTPPATEAESAVHPEHAYYCFDVIHAKLNGTRAPPPRFDDAAEYPLFVTWNIESRSSPGHYRLRGCIGNFEPQSLGQGLRDYAAISAFKDHRFEPISLKELPRLQCGVSLLTDFELCESYTDWTIDTHGIYIQLPNPALGFSPPYTPPPPVITSQPASEVNSTTSLSTTTTDSSDPSSSTRDPTRRPTYRSISRLPKFEIPSSSSPSKQRANNNPNHHHLATVLTATYLPDVASAQGWTQIEAVDSAIKKAGFSGRVTEQVRQSCRVTRYQSQKVYVGYDEWRAAERASAGRG